MKQWNMRHSWGILNMVLKVLSPPTPALTLCHNGSTRLLKLLRSTFPNSILLFPLSLWPLNWIFWQTQFHSICNGSDSFPAFLNTSLVFLIFSWCVKLNDFSIRNSLPLYYSFIQRSKGGSALPFENCLLLPCRNRT